MWKRFYLEEYDKEILQETKFVYFVISHQYECFFIFENYFCELYVKIFKIALSTP